MESLKDWASFLEWLKRPFFAFAATVILALLLLWGDVLDWLGLKGHRAIVSAVFLVSVSVLFAQSLAIGYGYVGRWKPRCSCRKRLKQLTRDEKAILKRYIEGQTRTQDLDFTNGVVIGLENAGCIARVCGVTYKYELTAFNISDFAWKYLNKHPEALAN